MYLLWYFAVGTLAAFGALCTILTVLGWLLPAGEGCAIVCFGQPDEEILARSKWLREMGFLPLPLIIVEGTGKRLPGVEYCSREELVFRLERERIGIHGTGNGNSAGHHQCGGVPEL